LVRLCICRCDGVTYTRGLDLSGNSSVAGLPRQSEAAAGGIGGLLARTGSWASGVGPSSYYHADGNGNITCIIHANQQVVAKYLYDPFGNTVSQSGTLASKNSYRFSSKEVLANSEKYYFGYRFYDPVLQRWLNRDPLMERGFAAVREKMGQRFGASFIYGSGELPNLYDLSRNDPVNEMDPLGLYTWGPGYGTPGIPDGCPGPKPPCSKRDCKAVCKLGFGAAAVGCGLLPPGLRQLCQLAALGGAVACDRVCDDCTLP